MPTDYTRVMRQARSSLDTGDVIFQWPAELSDDDKVFIAEWVALVLRAVERTPAPKPLSPRPQPEGERP